jgi:hypothetical protein
MSRSKSLTAKTHAFLTHLGLHPVGGVEKVDKLEIVASATRGSVRSFMKTALSGGQGSVGDFDLRFGTTAMSRGYRRTTATVYHKGTWFKLGWITFITVPRSQVVKVILNNEF